MLMMLLYGLKFVFFVHGHCQEGDFLVGLCRYGFDQGGLFASGGLEENVGRADVAKDGADSIGIERNPFSFSFVAAWYILVRIVESFHAGTNPCCMVLEGEFEACLFEWTQHADNL